MLKVKQFAFSLFGVNTYLVIDEATKDAIVIDPAMADPAEQKEFDDYVRESKAKITQIVNTHLHLDHCFGENYVKDKYGVPVAASIDDAPLGESMALQYSKFGLKGNNGNVHIDVPLKDGDIIHIGDSELKVLATPGHTPGGLCLYSPNGKIIFSGDTLFQGSVGRTDLAGGNHNQLIKSIREKLFTLPNDVTVLPGHGPHTTIGWEKSHNPYV